MKIAANTVVSMHYQVKNSDDEILDTSEGKAPLNFIQGKGFLIPGLEAELNDKQAGDKFVCTIEPVNAYGEHHEGLVQRLPIDVFDQIEEIHEGMQLRASTDQGEQSIIITKIEDDFVTVDGNHPLAGLTLTFDVDVVEVREATEEELAHGHVHAEGGCGHEH
ncbi:FKBP-type peptidyl-prolyl cis-trans isomerase [Catenovulum adriaticum]|uniref:Peptidyl-prolyl cis-trans isomerase n=1 Tax=Catenovulum adriaticum TaxID=2984846 RepID=A0ABY7AV62_9ALTE|nr:peptidylprolyl isomerase [Catenovulum sp. TS8]WAJ72400.1 peptidylprolyl isomerase [Catenovulum sp. TS8]